MLKNNYSPIEGKSTRETFLNYIAALDIPQIDYFAIGVQNTHTKTSISLMSLPEWQNYFLANQLANHDPIRKVALNTTRNFIPFEQIDFVDNFGKEIMQQRFKMGIKNGIILMQRFAKYNYMITLGTSFSQFDAFDFIKRYHDKIGLIKNDFISLIEKDAQCFIPATNLDIDAK